MKSYKRIDTQLVHAGMTPEQRQKLGISDRLIRMSVGIEATEELVEDLAQALASCAPSGDAGPAVGPDRLGRERQTG